MPKLHVKVVPGASRDEVAGWLGNALKIRVSVPPVKGQANKAVIAVLAAALNIPTSAIRVTAGNTTPRKTLEIDGVTEQDLSQLGT